MSAPNEAPEVSSAVRAVVLDHAQRIDALQAVGTDIALNQWASQDVPRMEADDVHRLNGLLPNLTWGERWDWAVTLAKAASELLRADNECDSAPCQAGRNEIAEAKAVLTRTAENALAADAVARAVAPQRPEDCKRVIMLLAPETVLAGAAEHSARLDDMLAVTAAVGLHRNVSSIAGSHFAGMLLLRIRQLQLNPPPLFAPASTVPTPGVQADGHPVVVSPDTAPGGPEVVRFTTNGGRTEVSR